MTDTKASPSTEKALNSDAVDGDHQSTHSDPESLQAGVQKALILKKAWTRKYLIIAFSAIIFADLVRNLSDYAGLVYQPYATSDFKQHSMMSVSSVVSGITRTCSYPIIAKLCDVFGRAEMFIFAVVTQTLAMALFASSQYIDQYAAANVFDAIGGTAFGLTEWVFIADATDLVNRGLVSVIPETLSTLPAIYLGTIIGESVLIHSSWRWGWGMWAIIFPVCSIPLIASMLILQKRAIKHGLHKQPKSIIAGVGPDAPLWRKAVQLLWVELDIFGGFLLVAGLSLILIPLSLSGSNKTHLWKEASFISMLVLGVVILIAFAVWDAKYAKKPFIPYRMISETTVIAACLAAGLDFMSYVIFTIFFPSYLQVAGGYSPGHATRIDNALRVSNQVFGLMVGFCMKYTKRSQMWVLMGPPVALLSQGIMIYLVNMGYGRNGNEAAFVTAKVLNGFGRACLQTAGQVSVQATMPPQQVAVATAVFQAAMTMGSSIGTSLSGAIWRSQLPKHLNNYLPEDAKQNATAIFQSIRVAMSYPAGSPVREAINQSYRDSQRTLAIAATSAAVPVVIAVLFMKNINLSTHDATKEVKEDDRSEAQEVSVSVADEKKEEGDRR